MKNTICGFCGILGHQDDSCIICDNKMFSLILRRNMNQFNELHGDKPDKPPSEWDNQTTPVDFKPLPSDPNTSPVVSNIMVRINNHAVDDVNVEVYPSYYLLEYPHESIPHPDNTLIKSIDNYEMDQLLKNFTRGMSMVF